MQTTCEVRYRGRVMSAYSMLFLGGPAIGLPAIGALAELVGLQLAFAAGILATAGIVGYVVLARKLR
jgi:MFS family permease